MTLVYCGSLSTVHSHKPASPCRVSALRPTSLHHVLFFLAQVPYKHCPTTLLPTLTEGSLHEKGRSRRSRLEQFEIASSPCSLDTRFSPHVCHLSPSLLFPCARAQHCASPQCAHAGRAFVESRVFHQIGGQRGCQ